MLIVAWVIRGNDKPENPMSNSSVNTEVGSEKESKEDLELNSGGVLENESEEILETENFQEIEIETEVETTETPEKEETEVVIPPTSETKEPEEAKPKWTVTDMNKTMYVKSSVNVRKGPGTEYEKFGSLSTNQEVKVTGKCNEVDWYKINYYGNEGYVNCSYLTDQKVSSDNTSNDTDNNVNNDLDNNTNNTENENNSESNSESENTEEIVKVPTTPEPEWGTISLENENQKGEWKWNFLHVTDIWTEDGWTRELEDTSSSNLSPGEMYDFAKEVYPMREDEGEYIGQRIEYPTFWIYLNKGHF